MKSSKTKSSTAKTSILAASLLMSLPIGNYALADDKAKATIKMSGTEQKTAGKGTMHMKFSEKYIKIKDELSVVGMDNGKTVYKNSRGEYFTIDPNTGDMRTISSDIFMKFTYIKMNSARTSGKLSMIKFDGTKANLNKVSIVGVDDSGNVIQTNSRGEKFYLNPTTGDMVFVK